jgi:hypothetical protein
MSKTKEAYVEEILVRLATNHSPDSHIYKTVESGLRLMSKEFVDALWSLVICMAESTTVKDNIKLFAKTIEEAARIREESWHQQNHFYKKNIETAVREAVGNTELDFRFAPIIELLLSCVWNDALEWAEEINQEKASSQSQK